MSWSWLFSVVSKWKLLLGGVFATALIYATTSAIYWRLMYQNQMELSTALTTQAAISAKTVNALLLRAREEHEKAQEKLRAARDASNAELDRVRNELVSARSRIDSLSAGECRRTSKVALEHLERGAELATRCAQELSERQQALVTCVRMYQDLESVYNSSK